jgi:hypothetical protein
MKMIVEYFKKEKLALNHSVILYVICSSVISIFFFKDMSVRSRCKGRSMRCFFSHFVLLFVFFGVFFLWGGGGGGGGGFFFL